MDIQKILVHHTVFLVLCAGTVLLLPVYEKPETLSSGLKMKPEGLSSGLQMKPEGLSSGLKMKPEGLSSGLKMQPEGLSLSLEDKKQKESQSGPSRIDAPIVNMPKPCLKEAMSGKVLEKNKCPKGQVCTKGPKEITKNGKDLRIWFCEKEDEENTKTTEKPLRDPERMQGDQGKTDASITTTQPPKKADVANWYFKACSIIGPEGYVVRQRPCGKGMECSGKVHYYWLYKQNVQVQFCQKIPPKMPEEFKGIPHWVVCYLLKSGYMGGKTMGELPMGSKDGFVPVANC